MHDFDLSYIIDAFPFNTQRRFISVSEDYGNSYEFFFHVNENRKDILTVINRLGEMLVFYDVQGDVDDWAIHVEKVYIIGFVTDR